MNNGLLGFSELANAAARNSLTTSTSSATNVVLSTTANQTQNITMSAAGLAVVLPSALQYPYGNNPVFLIRNTGTNVFDVQDSTGQPIFAGLAQNKSVIVWLRDNTTAAGSWSLLSNQAVQTILNAGTTTQYRATTSGFNAICQLNSTTAIAAFTISAVPYVCVLNLAGATVTVNTAVTVEGNATGSMSGPNYMAMCQVATNQVVLVTQNGTAYAIQLASNNTTLSISGSVPFGPTNGFNSTSIMAVSVASAGNNNVVISYINSDNTVVACVASVDSNNNICIMGVANSLARYILNGAAKITNIGVNQLLVTYVDPTATLANSIFGYVLTGTAGVYAVGPKYRLTGAVNSGFQQHVCSIGNNQAILTYGDAVPNVQSVVISITGTTLAANSVQQVVAGGGYSLALCQTSTGNALVLTYNGTTFQLYALSVTGTAITVGTPVTATGVATTAIGANVMCQTNTNKVALVYWDASNTFARVISVSGTTITYNAASTAYTTLTSTNPSLSICQTNTDQACIGAFYSSANNWVASSVNTAAATAVITGTTQIGNNVSTAVGAAVAQSAATGAFVAYYSNAGVNSLGYCAQGFTVASGSSAPVAGTQSAYWAGGIINAPLNTTFQFYGAYASPGYSVFIAGDNYASVMGYTIGVASSGSTITVPTQNYSVGTGGTSGTINSAQAGVTGAALIAWTESGNNVSARYATASGYTISFGTAATGLTGSTSVTSVGLVYLSTNYWLLVYNNGTAANGVRVLNVVGTTINSYGNALTSGVGTSVNARGSIVASAINSGLVVLNYTNTTVSYSTQLLTVATLAAGVSNPVAVSGSAITTPTTSPTLFAQDTVGPTVLFGYTANAASVQSKAIQYVKE